MRKRIKPIAHSLGITRFQGWHTFRHTYSSLLGDAETNLKIVQELMRHASIRTTLDTYTQAVTPSKREAQSAVVSQLLLRQMRRRPVQVAKTLKGWSLLAK
jgi:integrase